MLQVNTPVCVHLKWSFNGSGDADGEWYIFGSIPGIKEDVKIHIRDFCKVPAEDAEKVSEEDAKKIFLKLKKDSMVHGVLQSRMIKGKLEYFLSGTNRIVNRKGHTVFSLNSWVKEVSIEMAANRLVVIIMIIIFFVSNPSTDTVKPVRLDRSDKMFSPRS